MDWRDWLITQGNWDDDTKNRIRQYENNIFLKFINIHSKEKILCDCGTNILKKNWLRHKLSVKHTQYILLNFD